MSGCSDKPELVPLKATDRIAFERMAIRYFKELDPSFRPHADWKDHYFKTVLRDRELNLKWIRLGNRHAGFVLFGKQSHRFLPRKHGVIFEFYLLPQFRRRGMGLACACLLLAELKELGMPQVQLEVAAGNKAAVLFWAAMGFQKRAERFGLTL